MLTNIKITNDNEYFAYQAVSASQIKTYDKSIYEFWRTSPFNPHCIQEEDKDALAFGGLAHCMLLEPEEVNKRFIVVDWGTKSRSTAKYKAFKKDYSPDVTLILPAEYDKAQAMLANLRGHNLAAQIIKGATTELPITWTDDDTGLPCKAKIDAIKRTKQGLVVIDYKTSSDIDSLLTSAQKFQYPLQAVHYSEAVYQKYGEYPAEFVFIIQSNKEGYDDLVCVANVDSETMDLARIIWRQHLNSIADKLAQYAQTEDKNIFNPYPERCFMSYSSWYLNHSINGEL